MHLFFKNSNFDSISTKIIKFSRNPSLEIVYFSFIYLFILTRLACLVCHCVELQLNCM